MRRHRKSLPSPWAKIIGECGLGLSNELAPCKISHLVALGLELSQAYEKETDRYGRRHRLGDRCCPSFHLLALSFDFMFGVLQVLPFGLFAKRCFTKRSLGHLTSLDISGRVYRGKHFKARSRDPDLNFYHIQNDYQWDRYLNFIGARFCGTIRPLPMRIFPTRFSSIAHLGVVQADPLAKI